MLHQPLPKSPPRFNCPLTSPIFNTHLRKSTTLPKQPHKHGREEGYAEDRATSSAPAGHADVLPRFQHYPAGGREAHFITGHFFVCFIFCLPVGTPNQQVGGIFRGINTQGAQHKRAGSSDLLVSRHWSLHCLCRELGSKAELFPQERSNRPSPATPLLFPGLGMGQDPGAAAEDKHGSRTCNGSCSFTEDFAGRLSLPARDAPGHQSPRVTCCGSHLCSSLPCYAITELTDSSASFPRAGHCRTARCPCSPQSAARERSAHFPRQSQAQCRPFSGWNREMASRVSPGPETRTPVPALW